MTAMSAHDFTTDDIVVAVEIPGVYDGTSCWLLTDGRIVNRFTSGGQRSRTKVVDQWIARNGDALRREWLGSDYESSPSVGTHIPTVGEPPVAGGAADAPPATGEGAS